MIVIIIATNPYNLFAIIKHLDCIIALPVLS
jgi:hypothetical protein